MHILVKYKLKGFFYIQIIFIFSILCGINPLFSQSDSLILKVHFLYGSKPAKHYKKTESKYFGGLHGGHVTIELENIDYGFSPSGKVHIFAHKKNYHGAFGFYDTQGKEPYTNEEKYAIVKIPISKNDAIKVKEIFEKYLELTPYDYAFFGMRCAAAANDVLSQIGLQKKRGKFGYVIRTFYPKKLRKRLFKLAKEKKYTVFINEGKPSRKWEKD